MTVTNVSQVVFEKTGEVRDASGARIGSHDPEDDAKALRALYRYVGEVSRERFLSSSDAAHAAADVRTMALPGGELGQAGVSTQATEASAFAGKLEPIADIVCPVTFVNKTSGTVLFEDVSSDAANAVQPASAGVGPAPILNPKLTSKTIDATADLALAAMVPVEVALNSDLSLERLALRRLVNAHKLNREIRVSNLFTSTNFGTGNTTAAAVKWNGVTPTPLVDVFAALGKSISPPTHLIFTEAAAQYFFANANVYQYIAAGGPLPTILVAKMRKLASAAATYVWGGATSANAMLVVAGDDPEAVSTARTFRYVGDAPDKQAALESNGYLLRSYTDKAGPRGHRSLVLVANDQEIMLSGQLGGIVTGVLA